MPTLNCPIISLEHLNQDTRRVVLDTGNGISFLAGQYLEVVDGDKRYPFSIASSPLTTNIELHVRPTPNSSDSSAFEKLLDTASSLMIDAPKGKCYLDAKPSQPLLLIAASTGVTQMKSIIETLLVDGLQQPVYLYWGVLSEQDLYLTGLCEKWSSDPNFHFVPVVSEPATSPRWKGKTGLVGKVALEDFDSIENLLVIVGGSPNMVYATLDMFTAAGLPESNMMSDVFEYAPRA